MLSLGFSGTRFGMSPAQHSAVWCLISTLYARGPMVAHHGDCIGADAEFHAIVRFHLEARIVIHPGPEDDRARQAGCVGDERLPPDGHMRRNKAIVRASHILIGAPFEDVEQDRGGTWSTIRMGRAALRAGSLRELYVIGRAGQTLEHRKAIDARQL